MEQQMMRTVKILTYLLMAVSSLLFCPQARSWAGAEFYSIHVESFSTAKEAALMVDRLKSKGYTAFRQYHLIASDNLHYGVYVGKFNDQSAARDRINNLLNSDIPGYYTIVTLPSENTSPPAGNTNELIKSLVPPQPADNKKPSQNSVYFLHIGSYLDYESAKKELERLEKHDLNPFLKRAFDRGLVWYRIYIGAYGDAANAQKAGNGLVEKEVIPLYAIDYVPNLIDRSADNLQNQFRQKEPPSPTPPANGPPSPSSKNNVMASAESRSSNDSIPRAVSPPVFRETASAKADRYRWTIGLRMGPYLMPDLDEFTITRSTETMTQEWHIDGQTGWRLALPASLRLNRHFSIEGGIELVPADKMGISFFTLDPKLCFPLPSGRQAYLKAGMVYGMFDWSDAPGRFDNAFGWETGGGIEYVVSAFRFGAEFLYRDLKCPYSPPGDQNIVSHKKEVDLSGYSLSISLEYLY